jgi:hypothetical protein
MTSLRQRLTAHARDRWPQLTGHRRALPRVRRRGAFVCIDSQLPGGQDRNMPGLLKQ